MLQNGNHGLCYTSCGALAGVKVRMSFKNIYFNPCLHDLPQGMLENGNHGLCYTSCGALAGMKVRMSFKNIYFNPCLNDLPQGMLENGNHGLCYTSCGALAGLKVSMRFKICFQAMSTRPTPGDAGEWKPSVPLLGPRQSSRLLVVLRYTAGPTFGRLSTTRTNNEEKKHFI